MQRIRSAPILGSACLSVCLLANPAHALALCKVPPHITPLDKIIDKAVDARAELVMTTEDSRSPIYEDVRLAGNMVYFVKLSTSVWEDILYYLKFGDQDSGNRYDYHFFTVPSATVHTSPLSRPVANRVTQVYRHAIRRARLSYREGFDGTTYRFAAAGAGCRETWSPDGDSLDGELVELRRLLAGHRRITWSFLGRRSEREIVRTLERIAHRFQTGDALPATVTPGPGPGR